MTMMAVVSASSPMTGAASVVGGAIRAFGLHHLSLHPPSHLNLFSASKSTTIRSSPLLKIKNQTPFPHLFFLLNPHSPPYPHKCHIAITGDENIGSNEEYETEGEEEGSEADENEGEEERRKLYVGNLPYSMTKSQLADVFQEAGIVDAVEVVYDRVTDRSRGFAFVTMGSVEEAKEAVRMFDGSQIGGRTAKVNFPEVPRGGEKEVMGPRIHRSNRGFTDSPYKVYAGNLSWVLTSEALMEAFQDQPGFLGAKIIYERDTGRSRGFGFVSFASAEDAESALNAMNGVEVGGRPLRLNVAAQRERNTVAAPPQTQETVVDPLSNAMQSSLGY